MAYAVKEIFYSLQGEGAQTGRASVFCRFAGCNLWSGREEDRESADCNFCDTDFVGTDGLGGGKFADARALAEAVKAFWPEDVTGKPYVICTGGEPALQLDKDLIDAFHWHGFDVAIETNGTLELPQGIDWVCVSPKGKTDIVVTSGDELKLVYPQAGQNPENYAGLNFRHFFLQPLDAGRDKDHTKAALDYCLHHPHWRLSLQTHKILDIR